MRLWMLRLWSLAITGLAQNTSSYEVDLMTALSQYSQLTTFTTILTQYPHVWNQTAAGNWTKLQVLAPSNDVISDYLRLSGLPPNDTNAIFEAWVTYHILNGTHSKDQLQSATQFIPTLLTDPDYNNVTGGQRVEVQSAGEQVYLLSGNKSRSNIVHGV
ncbi:hypothetical protein LTR69_011475 [Exophiala sideris]|uniref:FAS1 domain-containing protein n=1 Tax=Exophiala sideris TaxID=1016849 RepID=A0ABR0IUI5_9EURO|nr:hypothetical protein LTR69_011475 [Exophiala sideris]